MAAAEQNRAGRYSPDRTISPPRDINNGATPAKLHELLTEVNKQIDEGNTSHIINTIDMNKAKTVMKGMKPDQQELVEQLLNKLRDEQYMRLQSEEQHAQMMQQMGQNQQSLEI